MIYDNEFDYEAKLILAVFGECENCSYFEKILVACVGWNRFRKRKFFNSIEKDFFGYKRNIKIDNPLSRESFIDTVKAVKDARILTHEMKPKFSEIYFFNLHGQLPKTRLEVKEIFFKKETKHHFFAITNF